MDACQEDNREKMNVNLQRISKGYIDKNNLRDYE